MKKIIFVVLFFALVTQYGFSQFFFGGALSLGHERVTIGYDDFSLSVSATAFGINPILGYRFYGRPVDIGLNISYNVGVGGGSDTPNVRLSSFGIGVFTDFTFISIDRFSFLGRANVFYLSVRESFDGETFPSDEFIGLSLTPMFEYSFSDRFSLFTGFGGISYAHLLGEFSGSSFSISIFSNLSLGFRFFPGGNRREERAEVNANAGYH